MYRHFSPHCSSCNLRTCKSALAAARKLGSRRSYECLEMLLIEYTYKQGKYRCTACGLRGTVIYSRKCVRCADNDVIFWRFEFGVMGLANEQSCTPLMTTPLLFPINYLLPFSMKMARVTPRSRIWIFRAQPSMREISTTNRRKDIILVDLESYKRGDERPSNFFSNKSKFE